MTEITVHHPPARLTLFGFKPTKGEAEILYRPRSWRVSRSLISLAIAWGITPVVALIPPHVPWAALAFGAGIYLAVKRWTETYTIQSFQGDCPKCGEAQTIDSATKLKIPHSMTCSGCQRDLLLEVDVRGIGAAGDATTVVH